MYGVADAQIAQAIGAFARIGHSREGAIRTYLDAGVRGTPSWRQQDLICVGIAFAHALQGAETLVEGSYELQVHWLSIQPDLQLIFQRERTIAVGLMRLTVAL